MRPPSVVYLDFETRGIEPRPDYPPKPVGVSLKFPGDRKPKYWAWGHPAGNNCTPDEGRAALQKAWASGLPICCHHGKFDLDVAETHFTLPMLPWERIHDTQWLLFLSNPHSHSLALKPAAEEWLGWPPEERDAVREWLVDNKIINKKASGEAFGANIWQAPGDVVAPYANGDVLRTEALFKKLWVEIQERGMGAAYDRERKLLPILLANERIGVKVDMNRLESDLTNIYRPAMVQVEGWLRKKLKRKDINLDANTELVEALLAAGLANEDDFLRTEKTGAISTSAESLLGAVKDPKLFCALGYRSRLATTMRMFMESWLEIGTRCGGYVKPTWKQVRSGGGKDLTGARSGRLIASDPNPLNLSKTWEGRNDGFSHAVVRKIPQLAGLPDLPLVRMYWGPDSKKHVWCHRDLSQQEIRVLAHFEDGALMHAYCADPYLDVHEFVRQEIKRLIGLDAQRSQTKILNFSMIYGKGLGSMAEELNIDYAQAKSLKDAQLKAIPGLKGLGDGLRQLAKRNEPLTTWGGREYYCEPPKMINGRNQTFEYKMLSYLIQPSSADITKEALIRYDSMDKESRFLVTVYDEINVSAPKGAIKQEMAKLREAMESIELDVPMLSDGKVGPCWGELEKYKEAKFDIDGWNSSRSSQ